MTAACNPESSMRKPLPVALLATCALVYLLAVGGQALAAEDTSLEAIMEGEFALQEGRNAAAAAAYVRAAGVSSDPALAERAARVALLANDSVLLDQALQRWLKLAPKAAGASQMKAIVALRAGEVEAASAALQRLIELPGDEGWRLALQALVGERGSASAGEALRALVTANLIPTDIEPLLGFGGLAQRLALDDVTDAIALRVTELHPHLPRPWLWRADIERQQENLDAARLSVRRALDSPELDTQLRLAAAAMLDLIGDTREAAEVLAAGEQTDATLAGRAAYLARAKATAELDALYTELQVGDAPKPAARLMLLGQLAELREQPAEALTWYRQITDPALLDQASLRIAINLDASGDLDAAIASLQAYQQSDSENGEALVNAYLLEAELLSRRGRHTDALAVYERALQVFEEDPTLLYARALGFEKLGRVDEAIADLRRLHAIDPDNADTMNALGYTLADRTDQFEEALSLITRALEKKPDSAAIIDSMGWVLYRLGKLEEALVYLRRAFELQRDAEVAAHLGEVLWVSGQQEEAQSIFRLGLEIDAENAVLKRTMKRLLP